MVLNLVVGSAPFSLCTKSKNLMQGIVDFNEDVRRQRMPWALGPFLWLPQVAACPERESSASDQQHHPEKRKLETETRKPGK